MVLSGDHDSDFVFYLLQFFKNELVRYACGSTFLELSKKDFEKRVFRVPGLDEQKWIAAVLNAAEKKYPNITRALKNSAPRRKP